MPAPQPPFRIGLCMAGAVSAGAYTAGVMDYLIEALEEWEHRKRVDPEGTPLHQVEIPVIGGASAGGMSGIITAAALHGVLPPVRWREGDDHLAPHPENRLYHSWVDLTAEDMFSVLLNTADIEGKRTRSMLNADFIDLIAQRLMQVPNAWTDRPFFPRDLKVFTTLTNLEGLGFDISFHSDSRSKSPYHISVHNDYACFRLNSAQEDYADDGWIPLDFGTGVNTTIARDAAMGTGAFPIGLRARQLVRPARYMNDNAWFRDMTRRKAVTIDPYVSWSVDGGIINNEPFDRVRELLNAITGEGRDQAVGAEYDYQDYARFQSTVLMIDPFPSELEEFDPADELLNVAGNTLGAMLGQLRVKPAMLDDAMDSDKAGQFLIAPSRKFPNGTRVEGAGAIACGTLGGFGGFLHKEFRVHDYFLGRANCEIFLRDYFTVPKAVNNPLFEAGYAHLADTSRFHSRTDALTGLQIIPIFTQRADHMPMPRFRHGSNWPVRADADIDRFEGAIKRRVKALIDDRFRESWIKRTVIKLFTAGSITSMALEVIKDSLRTSYLLPGEPKRPRRSPKVAQQQA